MDMDMVRDAFKAEDLLRGIESGGIEAPRILKNIIKNDDGTMTITWRHPDTCGLSDCPYHYSDTSLHDDVYSIKDGYLNVNEIQDPLTKLKNQFSWDCINKALKKVVDEFYEKYSFLKRAA